MKRLLPLHEMAVNFGLVSNHPVRKRGRPSAEKKREEDYVRQASATRRGAICRCKTLQRRLAAPNTGD